jgi:hypothetical protein
MRVSGLLTAWPLSRTAPLQLRWPLTSGHSPQEPLTLRTMNTELACGESAPEALSSPVPNAKKRLEIATWLPALSAN